MIDTAIASGFLLVLLSLPGFVLLWRREWRRSGGGLFLLSPAFVFYVAYLASFAMRPPLQVEGTLQYDFSWTTLDTLLFAQGGSLLTWYGFVCGYLLTSGRLEPASGTAGQVPSDQGLWAAVAYLLSASASIAFSVALFALGVFTLDFGTNRAVYSSSLHGAGHMYLFNLIAGTLLLVGLVCASFCSRPPRLLAGVAWAAYLVPNILVTNRFLVSAVLFALVLVFALRRVRSGGAISGSMVVGALLGLSAVGALLGLVRGLTEGLEYAEERRNPLVFFLWSFDQSEFFQNTLLNIRRFDLGLSWLEDIAFVFLPRMVFPWKPDTYGAVRLQVEAMPDSAQPDGTFSATYPISIFGEAYVNFGIPGLALVGLALGFVLKLVFAQTLRAGVEPRYRFWPLLGFCLYVLVCANSLGYLRSFGWFAATLIFHSTVFAFCYLAVWALAGLVREIVVAERGRLVAEPPIEGVEGSGRRPA